MENEKKNIFCETLTRYRKSLSLTQIQIATMINKELNLNPDEPGFVTQSLINKIEKGAVIVDYRITNFFLKKLLFVDVDKVNSAIELATYIYNVIDKNRIYIKDIFSIRTTDELFEYITNKSTQNEISEIKLAEFNSKLKIIKDNLGKLPKYIYVESILYANNKKINLNPDINSSGLVVLYFSFLYISNFLFSTKTSELEQNEILNCIDSDSDPKAMELISLLASTRITKDMNISVKSKIIKSILKKINFYNNCAEVFKEHYDFCLESSKYIPILAENDDALSLLSDNIKSVELDNDDNCDISTISKALEEIDDITNSINWPLLFLAHIYAFYFHKNTYLIAYPNKDYIEKQYSYIKDIINKDESDLLNKNTTTKLDTLFNSIINTYNDLKELDKNKLENIINLQNNFIKFCKSIESILLT